MRRGRPAWHTTALPELPDDEAQMYLPQGDLTQSYERHIGVPIVLYERTVPTLDARGNRFPILGYYLGGESNPLLERMAIAHLIFQGLWVLPIQQVVEEEKDSTGKGLPFNDGAFTYNDQLYRAEVVGTYPRYPSGKNLRDMYGKAVSKTTPKPQIAPRLECLTCRSEQEVYVKTVDSPVPHRTDHDWICWFPAGWPGSNFPDQPTVRLPPIDDRPEAMVTAMQAAITSKADKLRQTTLKEPVCLIVISQGFPIPSDDGWIRTIAAHASPFDTVLSVHIDGHIGFMENDSFSYEAVGQLVTCPLCRDDVTHEHRPVLAMIRHQFNDTGTWVIHATTNEETHLRNKQTTRGTLWHQAKL